MVIRWHKLMSDDNETYRRSKLPPNRETAYAKAIIAAGIAHAITKNCSRGEIKDCGCDPKFGQPSTAISGDVVTSDKTRTQQWSWGGCSDDPKYALEVTRKFLDGLEKGSDTVAYVGRHNARVGREIIRDTMVRRCRCHGISGSCSVQTCWMQVAPFEVVAKKLWEKYKKAVRLTHHVVEMALVVGNSARDVGEEKEVPERRKELIFLEQSPDYCISNEAEGVESNKKHGRPVKGLRGIFLSPALSMLVTRETELVESCSTEKLVEIADKVFLARKAACVHETNWNMPLSQRRSCRQLCRGCGHSVKKIRKEVTKRCNCTFTWCCEVKCQTCVENIDEHFCD
ncbi:hypothetical protein NQ318_021363 [Aromia moschata]|uniref:Protein Wnt n=1 Tax=Aromia moschata TaxID=1265417 RepID=A0AAV8ZC83_9CUCU|nr:hypothetical protein NQ318_021363 [Aromia moschata]